MTEVVLNITNVTVSYGGRAAEPAIENVSLTLHSGRIVGILGPNGAGKSTLIKAALGLVEMTSGEVTLFGQPLSRVRNQVVYIPQRGSVDWDFPVTVSDVVLMGRYGRLGLFGRPSKKDRAIAHNAMEKMGILPLADRQISEMSGGQQQRAFLARALAQEGDLLLMDEPFVGVDAATEAVIVTLLQEMRDSGKTVVVVNHDLHTAKRYFDELVMLNKHLVAHGPVEQVFTPEVLTRTYGGRLTLLKDDNARDVVFAG